MKKLSRQLREVFVGAISALVLTLVAGMAASPNAVAGEEDAKALLKAMTDYMAAQKAISFDFDSILASARTNLLFHPRSRVRKKRIAVDTDQALSALGRAIMAMDDTREASP